MFSRWVIYGMAWQKREVEQSLLHCLSSFLLYVPFSLSAHVQIFFGSSCMLLGTW